MSECGVSGLNLILTLTHMDFQHHRHHHHTLTHMLSFTCVYFAFDHFFNAGTRNRKIKRKKAEITTSTPSHTQPSSSMTRWTRSAKYVPCRWSCPEESRRMRNELWRKRGCYTITASATRFSSRARAHTHTHTHTHTNALIHTHSHTYADCADTVAREVLCSQAQKTKRKLCYSNIPVSVCVCNNNCSY